MIVSHAFHRIFFHILIYAFLFFSSKLYILDSTICLSVVVLYQHMDNGTIQMDTVNILKFEYLERNSSNVLDENTYGFVITSDHITVRYLVANTISRFIWVIRPITIGARINTKTIFAEHHCGR